MAPTPVSLLTRPVLNAVAGELVSRKILSAKEFLWEQACSPRTTQVSRDAQVLLDAVLDHIGTNAMGGYQTGFQQFDMPSRMHQWIVWDALVSTQGLDLDLYGTECRQVAWDWVGGYQIPTIPWSQLPRTTTYEQNARLAAWNTYKATDKPYAAPHAADAAAWAYETTPEAIAEEERWSAGPNDESPQVTMWNFTRVLAVYRFQIYSWLDLPPVPTEQSSLG